MFQSAPNDILNEIFYRCLPHDITRLTQTCQSILSAINEKFCQNYINHNYDPIHFGLNEWALNFGAKDWKSQLKVLIGSKPKYIFEVGNLKNTQMNVFPNDTWNTIKQRVKRCLKITPQDNIVVQFPRRHQTSETRVCKLEEETYHCPIFETMICQLEERTYYYPITREFVALKCYTFSNFPPQMTESFISEESNVTQINNFFVGATSLFSADWVIAVNSTPKNNLTVPFDSIPSEYFI